MFGSTKTSLLFFLVFLLSAARLSAQSVQYLPPFEHNINAVDRLQLLGQIEDNYLLYHHAPAKAPALLVLDQQGQLKRQAAIESFYPELPTTINFLLRPSGVSCILQELRNNKHYVKVAQLDKDGHQVNDAVYIDSTDYSNYGSGAFYNVIASPGKKHNLLYRIIKGFSSFQILFNGILLNEKGEFLKQTFFYVPINNEMEIAGNVFVNDAGDLFFPVYDKPTNFRLGTTLRIFTVKAAERTHEILEFYLKENKPTDLLVNWHQGKNRLVLAGLYLNFYSKNIDGSLTLFIDPSAKKIDTTIVNRMDRLFKKELKSKIYNMPATQAVNGLRAMAMDILDDGSVKLFAGMFTNSSYSKRPLPPVAALESPSDNSNNYFSPVPGSRSGGQANMMQERDISNYFNANRATARTNIADQFNNGWANNSRRFTSADQKFSKNQQDMLKAGPSRFPAIPENSSDIVYMNKNLDYKTVLFSCDPSAKTISKNWARSLFVPNTVYTNIVFMPGRDNVGLLSYEINNKNATYLLHQTINESAEPLKKTLDIKDQSLLFYKNNYLISNGDLLTLYADPVEQKIGLAKISWK